jgi:hypothetical protein
MMRFRFVLLLLIGSISLMGQFNHPELEWRTLEGEHFIVHFHQNTEWTANEALHVADEIYPAITSLYQYEPEEKTHLIIKDTDDYANGAAYYFDNKIEIWAMPLDYELRGSHYWLRDVITHEFTHIVSLRASRKFNGKAPASYVQVISYEPERREDVLYGYPNGIASYPLPSVAVPMWWAEGIAQYQSNDMRWDWWDSIRDMILRDRIAHGKLLTLNEMDGFGKAGIGNESVYDHGFSLVRYLSRTYGQDILRRITERIANPLQLGFYRAMEMETGIPSQLLWENWKSDLEAMHRQLYEADEPISPVHFVQRGGDANFRPRFNKDGSSLGFISSKGETYLSRVSLFVKDSTERPELLIPTAEGFDWAPDGQHLVYSRKEYYDGGIPAPRKNSLSSQHFSDHHGATAPETCDRCNFLISGSRYADLFLAHRDSLDDEIRLTQGERVKNPSWSPQGERIVFVNLRDGTNNLCLAYPEQPDSIKQLTFFKPGTQVYTPRWSPNGRYIAFDHTVGSNRDVSLYDTENDLILPLLTSEWDERDPVFIDDNALAYSDDRTGIFNIYRFDILTDEQVRLTNVVGGAFQAEMHGDQLYYSLYDSLGYNIAVLERSELLNEVTEPRLISTERIIPPIWTAHAQTRLGDDYQIQYGPLFLIPRIQIEIDQSKHETVLKPGLYFFSDEILNNYSMFGGVGVAGNRDLDLFIAAEYRGFLPTLTFEFFQMIRHTTEELKYYVNQETNEATYTADAGLTFSLTQGVLSAHLGIPPNYGLTFDVSASNYKTKIGNHRIDPNGANIPAGGISYDYFKGWDWGIQWQMSHINLRQERGINPSGYKASVAYRDNHHRFLDEYGYDEDAERWGNIFSLNRYAKLNLAGFYGYLLPIPGQFVISNSTELNLIDNNAIDDFFYECGGGLPGLKGYPYYSMKGSRRLISTSTLRFPIFRDNYSRLAQLTVRDLYLGFHGQIGSVWSVDPELVTPSDFSKWMDAEGKEMKWVRDVGMDLRLALNSYYAFPTAFEFAAYYGLDDVSVTTNDGKEVEYGGEWRFYWKVLFGFD